MKNARLHCTHGNVHFLGNFIVVVPVQEHGKGLSEIGLQLVDGLHDVGLVDHRRDSVHTVVLTGVDEVLVLSTVEDRVLKFLALVVVDEDVPHDGVQPPFHVRAFLEVVLVAEGFHHCVLHQIIRVCAVACEPQSKTAEKVRLADKKLVEFECAHDRFV